MNEHSEQLIEDTMKDLRVYVLSNFKIIGCYVKDSKGVKVRNAIIMDTQLMQGPGGVMGARTLFLPLERSGPLTLLIHSCDAEYSVAWLEDDAAKQLTVDYLNALNNLKPKEKGHIVQPKPGALSQLDRIAGLKTGK